MVTIKDLAKYCNYSVTTVSYALNGSSEIPEETKNKIIKAAKELNYVPSAYARGLKKKKTYNIGVYIPGFEGPVRHIVLAGLAAGFKENDSRYQMIVLLPDTPECLTPGFLSKLISMGIYNFTTNLDGVKYLLDNPNTYRDVAHLHQIDQETVVAPTPMPSQNGGVEVVNPTYVTVQSGPMIIGIKNITEHSGATMLTYMLLNEVRNMGKVGLAIEVGKRDFVFFNDKDMISIDKDNLAGELLKHRDVNVIFLDLNRDGDEELCNEVLYLLEPSTIKLNKLMLSNRNVFSKLEGRKIVINQNIMGDHDIKQLEMEANLKSFYILPPLDERANNSQILQDLLNRIGVNNY